jgi:uncharacterized membrane protein
MLGVLYASIPSVAEHTEATAGILILVLFLANYIVFISDIDKNPLLFAFLYNLLICTIVITVSATIYHLEWIDYSRGL